jgi:CDP-diacylglycerol--glycerol-3-phosphate 3-phosphatidyltransferase
MRPSGSRAARGWVAAAAATTVVLAGLGAWAVVAASSVDGALVLAAAAALVVTASAVPRERDRGSARERVLVALADRAFDAALFGALVWANRSTSPALAAAALWCFGLSSLSAYARARAVALGYDLDHFALTSVVRAGVVALAILLGWGTAPFVGLAVWLAGSTVVRASQVWKEGLA